MKRCSTIQDKAYELGQKMTERTERVARLREEHGIDDAALVQLLLESRRQSRSTHLSYNSTQKAADGSDRMVEKSIPMGVVNNLFSEQDQIAADKATVEKLSRVIRNIKPLVKFADGNGTKFEDDYFSVTTEEAKFLGF